MRSYLLRFSPWGQLVGIVGGTILMAFLASSLTNFVFGAEQLTPKTDVITAIYAVLGTLYAVLIAFSVSGVWQNYCAAELTVAAEAAALMDLIHTIRASASENLGIIRETAMSYLSEVLNVEWPILSHQRTGILLSPSTQTYLLSMELVHQVQTIQTSNARDTVIFSHALSLLTKWLDARRTRIMLSKGNIAKSLWPVLIAGAFILFAFHGLFIVNDHVLWTTLLFLFSGVIGLSFYLVFTLDSPFTGNPAIDAEPFEWALVCLQHAHEDTLVSPKEKI